MLLCESKNTHLYANNYMYNHDVLWVTCMWMRVSICVHMHNDACQPYCACESLLLSVCVSVCVTALRCVVSLLSFWASDKTRSHCNNMPSLYLFLSTHLCIPSSLPSLHPLSFSTPPSLMNPLSRASSLLSSPSLNYI